MKQIIVGCCLYFANLSQLFYFSKTRRNMGKDSGIKRLTNIPALSDFKEKIPELGDFESCKVCVISV